jgi:hypothetical protein
MRALGKSELWNVQLILALWIGFFCMLSEEGMLVSLISFLEKLRINIFVEMRWHDPRPSHDQTGDIIRKQGGIWSPEVLFFNQQRRVKERMG